MSQTQKALFLESHQGDFVLLDSVSIPQPREDEVLVRIHATALNPADWKIWRGYPLIKNYPTILGSDIAGEVIATGSSVHNVTAGDRVLFQGVLGQNEQTGFQQYATADSYTLAKIPRAISYDEASTIPLAVTTAYVGLYNNHPYGFGFDAPVKSGGRGKYAGTPIVIIGGSSSVGQFAIQLAHLSGFSPIIATSSLRHFDFLKSIGATDILDRSTPLTKSIINAITSKPITVVYDAISSAETQESGVGILAPKGKLAVVLSPVESAVKMAEKEGKDIVRVHGFKVAPPNVQLVREFWAHATGLLESGDLKPLRYEVLPRGLASIIDGLIKLEQSLGAQTRFSPLRDLKVVYG